MVYAEEIQGGRLYIYQGTSRANLTDLITDNGQFTVGAPIETSVSNSAVLIFKRVSTGAGSFQVSFRVSGAEYQWWQKPFLDKPVWLYYFSLTCVCVVVFALCCWQPILITLALAVFVILIVVGLPIMPCLCACYCLTGRGQMRKRYQNTARVV